MSEFKMAPMSPAEQEAVAEICKNPTEVRQIAEFAIRAMSMVVEAGRMAKKSDDQVFGDVVRTLAALEDLDVSTNEGAAVAVILAEFAVRGMPA